MNTTPAAPWERCRPCTAPVKIWRPVPGASEPRWLMSGWVAECPIRPRIETSAIMAGKIAWMP